MTGGAGGEILLRPWRLSDAGALYSWASDPLCALPADWTPLGSEEEARRRIIRHFLCRRGVWALCLADDRPVGAVRLEERDGALRLGYVLSRSLWGRGIVPAACAVLLRDALSRSPGPVLLTLDPSNRPSRRVAEKLGFRPAGAENGKELWRLDA